MGLPSAIHPTARTHPSKQHPRSGLGWVLAVGRVAEGRDELCSLTGKQIIGSMPGEPTQHHESLSHHTNCVIDVQLLGSMGYCNP